MSSSAVTAAAAAAAASSQQLAPHSTASLSLQQSSLFSLPPVTVTFTDVVYTTIESAADSLIQAAASASITSPDTSSQQEIPPSNVPPITHHDDPWTHRLYQLLPFLGVFAVIGLLTVLFMLCFLGYRFFKAGRRHRYNFDDTANTVGDHEAVAAKSNQRAGGAWMRIQSQQRQQSIVQEPMPARLRQYFRNHHHHHRHSAANHQDDDQPISSTFVPLETSPLTLVNRSDILQDPIRKRGVDEVALWEKKQQQQRKQRGRLYSMQDYPDSPDVLPSSTSSSETVQPLTLSPVTNNTIHVPPVPTYEKNATLPSHVALARDALQKSHLHNSSSQWLRPSGSSKSL